VNRLESQTRQPSLYFAATLSDHQQSYEIMKLLIDHGANPSFKDNYQQTVLFYVCKDGKEKCLDLLLAEGLSLDDEDLYGQIPLFYVAKENRMNIIHKLIEKKVNLNHIDKIAGQTALFYAAKEGHLDMCKVLVESGCDLTIQDTSGKIASHLARRQNRQEVF
jgi:ankyrin repeat protein